MVSLMSGNLLLLRLDVRRIPQPRKCIIIQSIAQLKPSPTDGFCAITIDSRLKAIGSVRYDEISRTVWNCVGLYSKVDASALHLTVELDDRRGEPLTIMELLCTPRENHSKWELWSMTRE